MTEHGIVKNVLLRLCEDRLADPLCGHLENRRLHWMTPEEDTFVIHYRLGSNCICCRGHMLSGCYHGADRCSHGSVTLVIISHNQLDS